MFEMMRMLAQKRIAIHSQTSPIAREQTGMSLLAVRYGSIRGIAKRMCHAVLWNVPPEEERIQFNCYCFHSQTGVESKGIVEGNVETTRETRGDS